MTIRSIPASGTGLARFQWRLMDALIPFGTTRETPRTTSIRSYSILTAPTVA